MEHLYEKALESAEYIKTHTKKRPKIAVVLGSGLGKLTADFTDTEELSYKDIPNFPVSTVAGHKGCLLYTSSLELAKSYDIHSIAFPAISTGVYGYPLDAATQIAVDTVTDWLQSHVDYDMRVIFCCFDARTEQAYQTKME